MGINKFKQRPNCNCIFIFRKSNENYNLNIYRKILLYDGENWTIKARDATRMTAAEMKYMRITARYTLTDHKTNTDIAKELNITPVLDKIHDYKRNWMRHVNGSHVTDYPD
jgi:hypothetical protein